MRPLAILPLPNGLTFNVVDVETANYDQATICQVGVINVVSGRILDEWATLVDPEDDFLSMFTGIHGIAEEHISDAPILPAIWDDLRSRVEGKVLIAHNTAFDRNALDRAADSYNLNRLKVTWRDSLSIARCAWPHMPGKHGLKNLTAQLGIRFTHHDALEDARAAAMVVLKAYGRI